MSPRIGGWILHHHQGRPLFSFEKCLCCAGVAGSDLDEWCWQKDGHTDPWSRIESPEIDPRVHSWLLFAKSARGFHSVEKGHFFLQMLLEKLQSRVQSNGL